MKTFRIHHHVVTVSALGWWELTYPAGALKPLRFSTENAKEGYGQLWFENGYFTGNTAGNTRIRVMSGLAHKDPDPQGLGVWIPDAEQTGEQRWKEGDRILNAFPPIEPYAGWICIRDPSDTLPTDSQRKKGIWKPFGKIE